jgi:hypothetical protein
VLGQQELDSRRRDRTATLDPADRVPGDTDHAAELLGAQPGVDPKRSEM